jgi:hypothetical protein
MKEDEVGDMWSRGGRSRDNLAFLNSMCIYEFDIYTLIPDFHKTNITFNIFTLSVDHASMHPLD